MDRERAKELAYGSLGLNPNSAIAMTIAGLTEVMSGNPGKTLELSQRAQRLSPRDPRAWFIQAVRSLAYLTNGEFEEAASAAKKSLLHNSHFGSALRVLAASLALFGQRENAAAVIQELLKLEPQLTLQTLRARLMYMDERVWTKLSSGLRLAGLPE